MKTVIHVWTHSICNHTVTPLTTRFGLGDLLRGAIGTLQYCEKRGYDCIIDVSLHPLSQLLETTPHRYSDLVYANRDKIMGIFTDRESFIEETLKDNDIVLFFTNFGLDVYEKPLTQFVVNGIQNVLRFKPYFMDYVEKSIKKIPYPAFSIIHFRLGDSELILGESRESYSKYMRILIKNKQPNQILLSDSACFKNEAQKYLFTFDDPVTHVGFHSDVDAIKHTLFEFLLVSRASCIYTFSVYEWTSGFVKAASYLYKVPLVTIDE